MEIDRFQIDGTLRRYDERKAQRERNLRLIKAGHYLAVDTPDRVHKFLRRRGFSSQEAATLMEQPRALAAASEFAGPAEPNALERVIGTSDLMGVAFLERGLQVARTVGRVWIGIAAGRPIGYGTGFLVSPRLFITNHHVLGDVALARASVVEFDYQLGIDGEPRPTSTFAIDPTTFHLADRQLDYAVVAIHPSAAGDGRSLGEFGFNSMIEEEGKAIAAQWVNIIQHPNGGLKQLALRENRVVDVLEQFLHYQTDTAPGSSGSPVYNDRWEVVALHHSGVWATNAAGQILAVDGQVWRPEMGEERVKWIANEGARISRVIASLRTQQMSDGQRRLFDEMLRPASSAGLPPQTPEVLPPVTSSSISDGSPVISTDGMATWTIPVSVSIRVGERAAIKPGSPTAATVSSVVAAPAPAPTHSNDTTAILAQAQKELGGRADVLGVRLGYVFKNGWITKDRAIVVTVRRRHPPAALREANIAPLPITFYGLPVEVTSPTIRELLRATQGPATTEALLGSDVAVMAEEIKYFPPPNVPLDPVTADMRVVAHVSPDNGWPQLETFLSKTRERLVVGMYDFGAKHIIDTITAAGAPANFKKLTLAIQRGQDLSSSTKADDLTDEKTIERLKQALGNKFESAWVKIGTVNGWVAQSYHIKVAVRDRAAIWLSSGNWQSSNLPNADPLHENPQSKDWLQKYNREWHAIVEHAGLAKTCEAYLLQDFQQNRAAAAVEVFEIPQLLLPGALLVPVPEEAAAPFKYFEPFDKKRRFTVKPLLTPDNFHQEVLKLINGAEEKLLIQNQTFNAPADGQNALKELVDAVLTKQRAGVDVRIIFRLFFPSDARENLSNLVEYGFNDKSIKVQFNCHTKGIVVDKKLVLLGSQNWSNLGVSNNRDASLLFDDQELANYFAEIFEHDWQNLAKQDIGQESLGAELASVSAPVPLGMIRLGWKDYQETL
jgi:V8-like Glu-specific endopeptidase